MLQIGTLRIIKPELIIFYGPYSAGFKYNLLNIEIENKPGHIEEFDSSVERDAALKILDDYFENKKSAVEEE